MSVEIYAVVEYMPADYYSDASEEISDFFTSQELAEAYIAQRREMYRSSPLAAIAPSYRTTFEVVPYDLRDSLEDA